MTTTEYYKWLNGICIENLGIPYMSEDKMVNVEVRPLSMDSDMTICPYCALYREKNCEGCPLNNETDQCHLETSPYQELRKQSNGYQLIYMLPNLETLVNDFNKANKFTE